MSNIIKGTRIRNEGVLDFSSRVVAPSIDYAYEKEREELIDDREVSIISEAILQKQKELEALEHLIKEKLDEANRKTEEIIVTAQYQANQIESEAKDKASAIIAEAYEKQEEILGSLESEVAEVHNTAMEEKAKMLQAVEGEVVETIIKLMQHVISEELVHHTDWIKFIVRKMLLKEAISDEVTLFISNQNMLRLKDDKEEFLTSLSKLARIEIDDKLNDTSLVIATNNGNIEYDVNYGLDKVISELRILKSLS